MLWERVTYGHGKLQKISGTATSYLTQESRTTPGLRLDLPYPCFPVTRSWEPTAVGTHFRREGPKARSGSSYTGKEDLDSILTSSWPHGTQSPFSHMSQPLSQRIL